MLSFAFILLAAICKAIADTLQHHYDTSVFKNMPFKFWNPLESYKYVKLFPLTKYRPDAWHLANSGMITFFILSAVFYELHCKWYFGVIAYGICCNLMFSLFYDKILRRK